MTTRITRRLLQTAAALIVVVALLAWVAGGELSAPAQRVIGDAPPSLHARNVTFPSMSGSQIHGWFAPGEAGRGAVLLLHGVRSDRRAMLSRAESDRLLLHAGPAGPLLAPLLAMQFQSRLGIDPKRLRPIDRMGAIDAPVLILNGTVDRHTSIEEARSIFEAATAPKDFWAVEGAAHVDLHHFAPGEYERRVLSFFETYMRSRQSR